MELSMKLNLSLIFSALLISGCANNWVHPTASQADFQRDMALCNNEAERAVPYIQAQPNPIYTPPPSYNTDCTRIGNTVNCNTTSNPTNAYLNQIMQSNAQAGENINRGIRVSNYFQNCMIARGYSLAKSPSSGLFHTSTPSPKVLPYTSDADKNLSLRDSVVDEMVAKGFTKRTSNDGRVFLYKDDVIHGWVLESGRLVQIKK